MTVSRGTKVSSPGRARYQGPRKVRPENTTTQGKLPFLPLYPSSAEKVKKLVVQLRLIADALEKNRRMDTFQDDQFPENLSELGLLLDSVHLGLVEAGVSAFQGGSMEDHSSSRQFFEARQAAHRASWFNRSVK